MARGALRGMAGGVLTLVVFQGLTGRASGRVGALVDTVNQLITRALDPSVPAIPDHSTPTAPGTDINPTSTGQASADGSSGHQWNAGGTTPAPATRVPVPTPAPAVHPLH
jgi:hypothetical protein